MPKEIDGVQYFTQEEVNGLTGTARNDGRASAEKHLLKDLGIETVDGLKVTLATAATLGAKVTDLSGQLETERTNGAAMTIKYRGLSLDRTAETIGSKLNLVPAKARQILKLLPDVNPTQFNSEDAAQVTALTGKFETFLKDPENSHFVAGPPETPGRRPNAAAPEKETEWSLLRKRVTAAQG